MSASFDKYVEKVIKPIYPKGSKIRQTSRVDDATGQRTVDWSFRGTNNKIAQAVKAATDNFTQSWGQSRGLLDAEGKPVPEAGSVPMRVSDITPQTFKGTTTRILNPRTAAAVRQAVTVSGGDFSTDKNTGMSTWSVSDDALTPNGKNLSRSLRAEVREGDRRWLEGKVALSSLADGASPANAEERAVAMNNRNYRVMLAKYKAMTPQQEQEEFKLRMQRRGRMAQYRKDYETQNPDDPFVKAKRERRQKQAFSRSMIKMKQTGKRAIAMARNTVIIALSALRNALNSAVGLLGRINATVMDIGNNVRRQAMEDMRYNFAAGFMRQWERFAEKRGFTKDVLSQAAGGIAAAWSTPLNYSSSNFEVLAPYLHESTRSLVRQATADGDQNVLHIMSSVIDDLVGKSLKGLAGIKQYTGQSRMTAAFTENMSALQKHNGAWAQLMQYYWYDLVASDGKFKAATKTAGKEANFEAWLTQADWNPDYKETGNGLSNETVKTAAEKTYETVSSLATTLKVLQTDVFERIAGSVAQVAEDVRSKISNLLARYFPAFAMKEKERAIYLNTQALVAAENNLPGYRASAETALKATGFTGTLEDFKPIWEGILKRDSKVLAKLPATVNLEALDTFIRYYAPAFYKTEQAVKSLNTENEEMAKKESYVPRVIIYDPDSNATQFSSFGMVASYGLQHIKANQEALRLNTGETGALARTVAPRPWVDDPNHEIPGIQLLDRLGLNLVTDVLTGQTAGDKQAGTTRDERQQQQLNNRITGSWARYKRYREQLEGYRNVADSDVLLLSSTGQMLSRMQSTSIRSKFHAAEHELYDYLSAMYDTGKPEAVLGAYDQLMEFYQNYGHLARVTNPEQATKLRKQIQEDTKGVLLGDVVANMSTVVSVDEAIAILHEKRAQYLQLNKLGNRLTDYQASQTLKEQARKQNATNDGTAVPALVERANAQLLQMPDLPDNVFDALRIANLKRLVFDVDEKAIANHTQAITNVYLQLQNGRIIPIASDLISTGLPRDVTVTPGQDVMQELYKAFSEATPSTR